MIDLKNVSKTYKSKFYEVEALKNVSLHIDKGELIAIMGSSGSGKTTLLNMIGLIDICDDNGGTIEIDGVKVFENNREKLRNKYITYVFQHFALIETDTVYENIELPMLARKIPKSKRKAQITELLNKLGISELQNQLPTKISGGQKQRVAIARALASGVPIVLADEPTGSLDRKNAMEVMQIMRSLSEDGKTVIIVTHDEAIAKLADRIIHIEDGKIFPPLK